MQKVLLALSLIFSAASARAMTLVEISFDQRSLQDKVNAKMPMVKPVLDKRKRFEFGTVRVNSSTVELRENSDKIHVLSNVEFHPRLSQLPKISGDIECDSAIRYDAETGFIYLERTVIEDIDLDQVHQSLDRKITEYLNRKVPEYLAEHPVYKLQGNVLKAVGRGLLQDVRVRNGRLVLKFGIGAPSAESGSGANARPLPTQDPGVDVWQYATGA